jgi:hypothetical protein
LMPEWSSQLLMYLVPFRSTLANGEIDEFTEEEPGFSMVIPTPSMLVVNNVVRDAGSVGKKSMPNVIMIAAGNITHDVSTERMPPVQSACRPQVSRVSGVGACESGAFARITSIPSGPNDRGQNQGLYPFLCAMTHDTIPHPNNIALTMNETIAKRTHSEETNKPQLTAGFVRIRSQSHAAEAATSKSSSALRPNPP